MKPASLAFLMIACAPAVWPQAKKTSPAKGRVSVLERLDQNIAKAIDGVALNQKQTAAIDKDRQAIRQAASARREGLNEDKKATEKALNDLEKLFKDKKIAFSEDMRQTVQEDVSKLLADARNEPRRNQKVQRLPNPNSNPFPRNPNPRRVPRW